MDEGKFTDGKSKCKFVLGDITNRADKRAIPEREINQISFSDLKNMDKGKRARLCSENNSLKGDLISGLPKVCSENRDPKVADAFKSSKDELRSLGENGDTKSLYLDALKSLSHYTKELASVDDLGNPNLTDKEGGNVLNSLSDENKCPVVEHSVGKLVVDLTITSGDANQFIDTEVREELDESCSLNTSKTLSEMGDLDGKKCDTGEVNMNSSDIHNGLDDHNDNFVLSQSGSIDVQFLPSQESRVFGIDVSTKSKEEKCTNTDEGNNSNGACSCSFCTKAAHMWLELHHKDIKSRISALKKGQRDASVMGERSCRINADEKLGVPNMEYSLMHQWRSLFKYMTKTWEEEGNQLEANLLQLNNLREKCKANLERFNTEQPEKR